MPAIRSAREISAKFIRVTPERATDYEAGVKAPKKDWATETGAASETYAEGVRAAIERGAFAAGVTKAGTGKWQRKAVELGAKRFGPGVRASQADYEKGFAPYRDVIQNTVLPPRYPKGDPRNIARVEAMAAALHTAKVA